MEDQEWKRKQAEDPCKAENQLTSALEVVTHAENHKDRAPRFYI
jgi:hypothetical protein